MRSVNTSNWDKFSKRIVLGLVVSALVAAVFLLVGILPELAGMAEDDVARFVDVLSAGFLKSCSQIELGHGRSDRCPDCKQSCPCRRASSGRQPRRGFAFGLSFARFACFEIRLDPTHARIECDRVRF